MPVSRFEDLVTWQRARDLALQVYRVTDAGAFARDSALRDQVRRAAVSVMSNIAEGFERYSRRDFGRFLSIARGSVAEVRSQLHLAQRLNYLAPPEATALHDRCLELSRLLASLHRSTTRA